ncbi:hypothetical protein TELCIR_18278, partial [Teladorsagia circumcincta]
VDTRTKVGYAIDVASGLDYLHSKNCMHRDIACRNCLINVAESVVKISHFGSSKQAEKYEIPKEEKLSLQWQAPEVIATRIYTAKCDVYSYGILVWEIFHNAETPFEGIDEKTLEAKMSDPSFRPRLNPELPIIARKVMMTCWQADPVKRPVMTEVTLFLIQAPAEMLQPPKKVKPKPANRVKSKTTTCVTPVAGSNRPLSKRKKSGTA